MYSYLLIIVVSYEGGIVSRANSSYGLCIYVSVCFKDVELKYLCLINMFKFSFLSFVNCWVAIVMHICTRMR
jgi:hypothetical protein